MSLLFAAATEELNRMDLVGIVIREIKRKKKKGVNHLIKIQKGT
jgi:hypothetical protein